MNEGVVDSLKYAATLMEEGNCPLVLFFHTQAHNTPLITIFVFLFNTPRPPAYIYTYIYGPLAAS